MPRLSITIGEHRGSPINEHYDMCRRCWDLFYTGELDVVDAICRHVDVDCDLIWQAVDDGDDGGNDHPSYSGEYTCASCKAVLQEEDN